MSSAQTVPRVLVMRTGQVGDTVFATSIIEPLRLAFGDSVQIDWVVKEGMAGLLRHDPRVGRIFEIYYRNIPAFLSAAKLKVIRSAWREPYDLLANLETGNLLNDLVRLVRATQKAGPPFGTAADDRMGEHAIHRLRRIFGHFLPKDSLSTAVPTLNPPPWTPVARKFGLPGDYIVLGPTNSHFKKRDYRSYRSWPIDQWRELIRLIGSRRKETMVLVGGRNEEAYFRALHPLPRGTISLAGQTALDELVAILSGGQALITTDTGPSHIAAAVGTPVLAIFGPSDFRRTGPFATDRNVVKILSAHLDCSPCSLTGAIRHCEDNRCMREVAPQDVWAVLEETLGSPRKPDSADAGSA